MLKRACIRGSKSQGAHCNENGGNTAGGNRGDGNNRASNYRNRTEPTRLSFAATLFDFLPNTREALLAASSEASVARGGRPCTTTHEI
jgi:hypothetical protein